MNDFELEKWYMDAHDSEGRAFIGYSARLRWKSITLGYHGYTFAPFSQSAEVVTQNSFSGAVSPEIKGDTVFWEAKNVRSQWEMETTGFSEMLLQNGEGEIDWNCMSPKATASITVGKEQFSTASGYIEKIRITILPWKLPIQQLYWGRYISADHTLVWIRWVGPVAKTLLFHNGVRTEDVSITEDRITFGNYVLTLNGKRVLRNGTILSTVFAKFPMIARQFPKAIMQLQENKWISSGILTHDSNPISGGKAIHEHVLW